MHRDRMILAAIWTVLALTRPLEAADTLRTVEWDSVSLPDTDATVETFQAPDQEGTCVRVTRKQNGEVTIPLLTIQDPGIQQSAYALVGAVRHQDVEGQAHLVLWNRLSGDTRFFSKTLGERGPDRAFTGDADWRRLVVPFCIRDSDERPVRLDLSLVMPGPGTVELAPLRLVEYAEGEDPLTMGQWWSGRTGGLIGGLFGGIFGLLGAVLGVLAGKGKARGAVMGLLVVMESAGVLLLATGMVALVRAQPYAVFYPLLLTGGLLMILPVGLFGPIRKRYAQQEARGTEADDT